MLVLCYGIQKSGSTLAFELVKEVLSSSGFDQPVLWNDRRDPADLMPGRARNYVTKLTKKKISAMIEEIGPSRRIAVKTHSTFNDNLFPWLEELQAHNDLCVIASYRDPRDICLSMCDRKARGSAKRAARGSAPKPAQKPDELPTFDAVQDLLEPQLQYFRKWASLRGTLRLDYDVVAFSPEAAIASIENALDVRCDHEKVKAYVYQEAHTLKNRAKRARYKDELDDAQKSGALKRFRKFIRNACEKDNQAWYDKYRERILAGVPGN